MGDCMAELWDIYDCDRKPTGRFAERGKPMNRDDYHVVVQIWIHSSKGKFLISKRSPEKSHGNCWETTGGSVIAGETSFEGALREVREELGVTLDPKKGRLIATRRYDYELWSCPAFLDIYYFEHDCPIEDVVLQQGETCDAKWATVEEIHALRDSGNMYEGIWLYPPFNNN